MTLFWLVSDASREYYDLGKVSWTEDEIAVLRGAPNLATALAEWLKRHAYPDEDILRMAGQVAAWMQAHPDWRLLSEYSDAFDDIYLAEDVEDAMDYQQEFGAEAQPVYRRTGSVWKEDGLT